MARLTPQQAALWRNRFEEDPEFRNKILTSNPQLGQRLGLTEPAPVMASPAEVLSPYVLRPDEAAAIKEVRQKEQIVEQTKQNWFQEQYAPIEQSVQRFNEGLRSVGSRAIEGDFKPFTDFLRGIVYGAGQVPESVIAQQPTSVQSGAALGGVVPFVAFGEALGTTKAIGALTNMSEAAIQAAAKNPTLRNIVSAYLQKGVSQAAKFGMSEGARGAGESVAGDKTWEETGKRVKDTAEMMGIFGMVEGGAKAAKVAGVLSSGSEKAVLASTLAAQTLAEGGDPLAPETLPMLLLPWMMALPEKTLTVLAAKAVKNGVDPSKFATPQDLATNVAFQKTVREVVDTIPEAKDALDAVVAEFTSKKQNPAARKYENQLAAYLQGKGKAPSEALAARVPEAAKNKIDRKLKEKFGDVKDEAPKQTMKQKAAAEKKAAMDAEEAAYLKIRNQSPVLDMGKPKEEAKAAAKQETKAAPVVTESKPTEEPVSSFKLTDQAKQNIKLATRLAIEGKGEGVSESLQALGLKKADANGLVAVLEKNGILSAPDENGVRKVGSQEQIKAGLSKLGIMEEAKRDAAPAKSQAEITKERLAAMSPEERAKLFEQDNPVGDLGLTQKQFAKDKPVEEQNGVWVRKDGPNPGGVQGYTIYDPANPEMQGKSMNESDLVKAGFKPFGDAPAKQAADTGGKWKRVGPSVLPSESAANALMESSAKKNPENEYMVRETPAKEGKKPFYLVLERAKESGKQPPEEGAAPVTVEPTKPAEPAPTVKENLTVPEEAKPEPVVDASDVVARMMPVKDIARHPDLQPRNNEENLAWFRKKGWKPSAADPIGTVMVVPPDNNFSGPKKQFTGDNTRLQFAEEIGMEKIPATVFDIRDIAKDEHLEHLLGTPQGEWKIAVEWARGRNERAMAQTATETAKSVKAWREMGLTEEQIIEKIGTRKYNEVGAISNLNPNGKFAAVIDSPSVPGKLRDFAKWTGDIRGRFKKEMTNAHEDEVFDFLMKDREKLPDIKKENFVNMLESRLSDLTRSANEPLNLKSEEVITGARAHAENAGHLRSKLSDISTRIEQAKTPEEKFALQQERNDLIDRIRKAFSNQTDIFGNPQAGAIRIPTAQEFRDAGRRMVEGLINTPVEVASEIKDKLSSSFAVLNKTESGRAIVQSVLRKETDERMWAGQDRALILDTYKKVSQSTRDWIDGEFQDPKNSQVWHNNFKYLIEHINDPEVRKNAPKEVLEVAKAFRLVDDTQASRFVDVGGKVYDTTKEGRRIGMSEFKPIENHYSHFLTRQTRRALVAQKGALYDALRAWASGEGFTSQLDNMLRHKDILVSNYGSLEYRRHLNFPDYLVVNGEKVKILETNFHKVINRMVIDANRRTAMVKHFGQDDITLNSQFGSLAREDHNAAQDFKNYIVPVMQGMHPGTFNPDSKLSIGVNAASDFARTGQLSASFLAQIGGFLFVPAKFGLRASESAFFDIVKNFKKGNADLEELRILSDAHRDFFNSYATTEGMLETSQKAGKVVLAPSVVLNKAINDFSIVAAKHSVQRALEAIKGGDNSWFKRRWGTDKESYIRSLKNDFEFTNTDIKRMLEVGMDSHDLARIAQRAPALTNAMGESVLDRPAWLHKRLYQQMLAYTSFTRALGKMGAFGIKEAKKGNMKPMAYWLLGGFASAELVIALKNVAFDKKRDDPWFIERVWMDIIRGGQLGLVGNVFEAMNYARDFKSGAKDFLIPPQFDSILQMVKGTWDYLWDHNEKVYYTKTLRKIAPLLKIFDTYGARALEGDRKAAAERLINEGMLYTDSGTNVEGVPHQRYQAREEWRETARELLKRTDWNAIVDAHMAKKERERKLKEQRRQQNN